MWKIPLFLLIVAGMGVSGSLLAFDLRQRRKDLDQFLVGLRVIEREISYETPSLDVCFERAAKSTRGTVSNVFSEISVGISENGSGEESVSNALKIYRDDLALTDQDVEQIFRFGYGLGENDLEHALKDLGHVEEVIVEIIRDAERNEQKWGRLFLHGGWLMGICAALFFI